MSLEQAKSLHQAGKLDEAKSAYQAVLQQSPDNVDALHWLAVVYAEEGVYDQAESYLRKALALQPDDVRLMLHLANILKAQLRYQEAITELRSLIKINPQFAAAYNNLGTIYAKQEKWQNAADEYLAAIKLQPDYIDAYYNLGLAQMKLKQTEKAFTTYEALLELVPNHVGGLFQLSCLLMQRNEYEKAGKQLKAIHEAYPHHFESVTNLATCKVKLGDLLGAKSFYEKALSLQQEDLQVLFNLGVINTQLGRLQDAVKVYQDLLAIDSRYFPAHYNLGTLYHYMQDRSLALTHLQQAMQLQPGDKALQHTLQIVSGQTITESPPNEYIQALFDSYADHYETHVCDVLQYDVPQQLVHLLERAGLMARAAWQVLDLGCGTGLSGAAVQPFAKELTGVDLSENMLAQAQEKNIYHRLELVSLLDFLPKQQEAFDLVMAADVLVYFAKLDDVLRECAAALRLGGYLLFNTEVTNTNRIASQNGRFQHENEYIGSIISKLGLKIIDQEATELRRQDMAKVAGTLWLCRKPEDG